MTETAAIEASPRRLEREAAKRRKARRGAAIAALSSVIVIGGLLALVLTSSGWPEVRETFFSWSEFKSSFGEVLDGFWLDVKVFIGVEAAVLVIALALALVRISLTPGLFPVRILTTVFVDVSRGIPTILLVYLIGFGIPALQIVKPAPDPVILGAIALTISYCGYVSEVYRAGIRSVHRGQHDAALAVGLTHSQAMRLVILPQAIRRVAPPLLERLRRAAEGRGADLDPRPDRGLPRRPDHPGRELQLHAADRGGAALPGGDRAAGPLRRPDGRPGGGGAVSGGGPVLEIKGVTKAFGERQVLRGIDLTVSEHEAVALIGASGSGKSTLLRCIDLLEEIDDGDVLLDGEVITDPAVDPVAVRRRLGFVFQAYNLFPHMTALQNVMIGERRAHGASKDEADERGRALLARFGLEGREHDKPDNLSGGQQQRIAIARAFAGRPRALLLDEVTSALDPELVGEVLAAVRDLKAEGMTMVIATHEMSFAREVADEVAFLHDGRLLEQGPPERLLEHPERDETRRFLGRLLAAGRI